MLTSELFLTLAMFWKMLFVFAWCNIPVRVWQPYPPTHFCYKLRVPTASINDLCFWFHSCFPRLWLTVLDLCVFFEFTICHTSHFSMNLHIRNASNCGEPPPPTCCVFDVIRVSLYVGLSNWICVCFFVWIYDLS